MASKKTKNELIDRVDDLMHEMCETISDRHEGLSASHYRLAVQVDDNDKNQKADVRVVKLLCYGTLAAVVVNGVGYGEISAYLAGAVALVGLVMDFVGVGKTKADEDEDDYSDDDWD